MLFVIFLQSRFYILAYKLFVMKFFGFFIIPKIIYALMFFFIVDAKPRNFFNFFLT